MGIPTFHTGKHSAVDFFYSPDPNLFTHAKFNVFTALWRHYCRCFTFQESQTGITDPKCLRGDCRVYVVPKIDFFFFFKRTAKVCEDKEI